MLENKIPSHIKKILNALESKSYQAYLVGGSVRDLLLNKEPNDYDITTSALPEQVLAICREQDWHTVANLGNNFGCVVAVVDQEAVEITTFRNESYGQDAHKPDKIWYCTTLQEDLSRRDFTINAMALDLRGQLYDFYGGLADLKAKIIRTVGQATKRYQEDALRMFRACRFVGQLGFTYVQEDGCLPPFGMENTPYYLPQNFTFPVDNCTGLSLERVRKEIELLLVSPHAGRGLMLMAATGLMAASCRVKENGCFSQVPILPELCHLVGLHQNPRYHYYDTWEHTLNALDNSPQDLEIRWATLLHDMGKGLPGIRNINPEGQPTDFGHEAQSATMTVKIMERFRYPSNFSRLVIWLVAQHMRFGPMLHTKDRALLHWVRTEALSGAFRNQEELVHGYTQLVKVFLADMGATNAKNNPQIMAEGKLLGQQVIQLAAGQMPIVPNDLDIRGRDLLSLVSQKQLPATLSYLLHRVQSGNLPNEKNTLLTAVEKNLARQAKQEVKR